jgi:mannose-6-phosphate isomerase-like protein (cupin superfamily)
MSDRTPMVHYLDQTDEIPCSYGDVRRIVTGGKGGVANVHVVRVTRGDRHFHTGYNEVYYILKGSGVVTLGEARHEIYPGAVVVIPAGVFHSLESAGRESLEFVIFGTPAMSMDDEWAKPQKD